MRVVENLLYRVEASIHNRLFFTSNMEKYKAVQNFHVCEDKNREDCIFFFGNFIP